jgi:hypothetical protein
MGSLEHLPRPKAGLGMADPVQVTLPAHVWLSFLASYGTAKWTCNYASAIALEARAAVIDPVWLKESEASHQQQHDTMQSIAARMLGQSPDLPPNMTDG